jgi:sulfofructose kinase
VGVPFRIRQDARFDVVALGENSLDFVAVCGPGTPVVGKQRLEAFRLEPGGQMATAALACARLGLRTRYVGAFGVDEWAAHVRAPLDAANVEVCAPPLRSAPSSRLAVILVEPSGERRVFEHRPAALTLEAEDIAPEWIADARVLLVDATQPAAARRALDIAREAGTVTICDLDAPGPDTEAILSGVDVVVVPEALAHTLAGSTDTRRSLDALAVRAPQARLWIVTCGERGVVCRTAGGDVRQVSAPRVEVIDTTGAGDAFRAGLAAGLLRLGPLTDVDDVLRFANAVAALNCRAVGAQTGLPTFAEAAALASTRSATGAPPRDAR